MNGELDRAQHNNDSDDREEHAKLAPQGNR